MNSSAPSPAIAGRPTLVASSCCASWSELVDSISWRAAYLINVALLIVALWATATFVAESRDADAVLTAHELLLVLRRVTAHEQSMNSLGTRVIGDGKLVVPVDFAIRRPDPTGPGAPCRDKLHWVQIMLDGRMTLFSAGRYIDEIVAGPTRCLFRSRTVVLDSSQVDTLIAIPL